MKRIVLILTVFASANCFAQSHYSVKEIKESNPITKKTYRFPKITGGIDSISDKINRNLTLGVLQMDTDNHKGSIFEKVWKTKEENARLFDLTYETNSLTENYLSITLKGEGCGAYCEYFEITYNYNLLTGDRISLMGLFTGVGEVKLISRLDSLKALRIHNQIEFIKNSLKKENADKELLSQKLALFSRCLGRNSETDLEYVDFKIAYPNLILTKGRCSNHANRALDDLGKFVF